MTIRAPIMVGDIPSPAALLGTRGSAQLLQTINDSLGNSTFFGSAQDIYRSASNAFIQNIVQPIREMGNLLRHASRTLLNPDEYRALETRDDFIYAPPCMQLPIVMYAPMRKLLEQGRISGYGYDVDNLPDEDVYGRLCNNGMVPDVLEACGENDTCELLYEWHDSDPDLSIDELAAIARTREAIDHVLDQMTWDPTSPTSDRG